MFEKKNGKRFLASVMALVMLLSLAPVGALATEGEGQPAENQPVAQPADETNPKPVETGTANTNEETTPPPANEGIAVLPANNNNAPVALPETPVIVKPTEVLDQAIGVDSDTSKDNGIAEYKGNNDGNYVNSEPTATEKMAELWITNAPVTANGSNSVSINSDIDGITTDNGVLVSELAPEKGRSGDNNVVFWQARILDSNHKQMIWQKKQTKEGHEAEAFRCKEITNRSSSYYQLQYKNENNAWTNIKSSDQIVFYYTAVTNLLQDMIQINITDWPRTDGGDNTVTYEVYVDDENRPTNQIITYYNTQDGNVHGRTTVFVDNVSVDMNQLEKYKVKKIERQYENQNAEGLSVNDSRSNFSIDLDNGNCTIKIYLERYKYVLSYELNEGSIASGTTYTLAGSYKEDDTITAPASESMSRTGYKFDGWYTDAAFQNPWTDDKMPSEDLMLYAKWEAKNYTVNYNLNYTDATNSLEAKTGVKWGDNNLLPSANPSREGFLFDAWYTQPTVGDKVDSNTAYSEVAANDTDPSVTLYAHWNEDPNARPTTTDVYVYFKMVDAAGNNIPKNKINNEDLKKTVYNKDTDGATWATLGKIASAETLTDSTEYKGTNTTLVTVGNEAKNQLKGNALYEDNTGIATTVLANIEWFQLKQWAGATGYVSDGSRWHLDGKITGYTVTYNKGTTDDVNKMPVADEMYYLSGSEYIVSDATPTRDGYVFTGWKSDNNVYDSKSKMTMPAKNVVLTAQWEKIYTVTFNAGDNGTLTGNLTQTGVSGTTLTEPNKTPNNGFEFVGWAKNGTPVTLPTTITEDATYTATWKATETSPTTADYTVNHYKWDITTKTYILDADASEKKQGEVDKKVTATAKTYPDYTLNTQASTLKGTVTANNQLTLNLYYDIDKIGDGENKDQPDGIPDRYQVTINYVSSNTNWGSVNRSKEVITLINKESGKWLETGTVTAPSCTATSAGGRCYFVNWTKKQEGSTASSTVTPSANLPEQRIENAKGGDVYTFTANFDRSSGGGGGGSNRPKPPVVEIPDDVPTGLNGKDHYAYIIGYGNNDVRPQNNITRAEVATIFFRLLTDETREANMTKSNGYNDVKDGDWFCCAVSTLSKMGIIKGYEDGSFKPNDPISRAEFAAIAARFDPDGDKTPATFADVTSHWAKDEISIAANHGWIKGYEDGSFKPDQKITRAETMTLVNRVLNRLPEAKDDLHKDMKTWVDNMDETAWYYLDVQEATNSHYFKNKTGTKFEQWTDLRDTRDWSELEK